MMVVRILVLGFYYPPDISAGAFRCEALVKALSNQLSTDSELEVLTTAPNRFGNRMEGAVNDDVSGDKKVRIHRFDVSSDGRGMVSQARAFASYAAQVRRLTRDRHYDLVIATSSRLMTAVLARWVAMRSGARLYLDIRDNFVDNLPSIMPFGVGYPLAALFSIMERWSLAKADRINLVSGGFEPYFRSRYPEQSFSWYTNGIDAPFIEAFETGVFAKEGRRRCGTSLKVVYAGNLGAGQGIEHILPQLAILLRERATFLVLGDGAGRENLAHAIRDKGITNVELRYPVPREELLVAYQQADVLFLHLNTLPSLDTVLPSKLFEYAATGKPILAGLHGYSATFANEKIENLALFNAGDAKDAVDALYRLKLVHTPREEFVEKWRRDKIMERMASDILKVLKHGS
ncbi:glycosyltransferase family 4 protein [Salinicola avicenniae]|uniref:glycosyltransferase family 4 protein n=1 Tax=Salinicola avicenniae TaxID=2916836 RepID=UPI0020747449|nr:MULTISPECIES: glycosyltransferase family 4 protein [unclassified Salinicola]